MAEEPSRPKPGSLKDRIKQFETSSSPTSSSPAPPPLRPKPGTLGQWKPKPVEPPSPTKQATSNASTSGATHTEQDQGQQHEEGTGLSASDAMSSIAKGGGTLRERMAALQGKGAFGAPASSAPPLPSSESKPRVWRTSPAPPVVPKAEAENIDEAPEESTSNRRSYVQPSDNDTVTEEPSREGDEEEEERERRAAIAARIARLGGARVGAPIGVVPKAETTKPKIVTSDSAENDEENSTTAKPFEHDEETTEEKSRKSTLETALQIPLPKSQGSLLSPGDDLPSESDATSSGKLVPPRSPAIPRSPDSMPMPALPKRTAGPRRKKSTKDIKSVEVAQDAETPPQIPTTETAETLVAAPSDDNTPLEQQTVEKELSQADLPSVAPSETATPPPPSPSILETGDENDDDSKSSVDGPTIEIPEQMRNQGEADASLLTPRPSSSEGKESPAASHSTSIAAAIAEGELIAYPETHTSNDEEEKPEEKEETEEEARRRRIAEKMARLGAVNPFTPGGFVSPISPRIETKSDNDEAKKESHHEENAAQDSKDDHDSSHVDSNQAHESESKVPILSLPAVMHSSSKRASATVPDPYERSTIQPQHDQSKEPASRSDLLREDAPPPESEIEVGSEDEDVDYPMMSPISTSTPGIHSQIVAQTRSPIRASTRTHDEPMEHTIPSQESHDLPDAPSSPPTIPPKHDTPPRRIGRPVPPPPPSFSAPNPASQEQPSNHIVDDLLTPEKSGDTAQPPQATPPSHHPPDSPNHVDQNFTSPAFSISPTPSPPPRSAFIRESAPSPPSLEERLGITDSDEEDEARLERDSDEHDESYIDGARDTPKLPESKPSEMSSVPASPPAPQTPSPIPTSARPIARRSIPPPPRHSLPPPPPPPATETPPTPRPQPPKHEQSLMMVSRDEKEVLDADEEEVEYMVGDSPVQERVTDKEVMDEDECDPIDPALVRQHKSPPRSHLASIAQNRPPPPPAPTAQIPPTPKAVSTVQAPPRRIPSPITSPPIQEEEKQEETEDSETARRRTIAERMAKLGGIKFGMPVPARPSPVKRAPEPETDEAQTGSATQELPEETGAAEGSGQTPEEAERARRAAIASRMAAMGARGFGMYGPATISVPTTSISSENSPSQSTAKTAPPPLGSPPPVPSTRPKPSSIGVNSEAPARVIPSSPPPPPPAGVKGAAGGETSESELEIVNAEMEDEEGEMVEGYEEEPEIVENPPPPPPGRGGRPPIPSIARPPPPIPKPSTDLLSDALEDSTFTPPLPSGRRAPPSRAPPPPAPAPAPPLHDYEILDGDSEVFKQPSRPGHSRAIPPPPSQPTTTLESSGQWELPAIPSGSFDLGGPSGSMLGEPDATWTKVEKEDQSTVNPAVPSTSEAVTPSEPFSGPPPNRVSAEALLALAQKQGPKILQSAQHVHEKSKRLVIGDGSSSSFLYLALAPTGASTMSLGHLIYAQSGSTIQKRLSDIMPGDIVALYDAKFKGHKGGLGLGNYSASYGSETDPVLGVVIEFEGKKSKIRAFAVNQHPNAYPTIDTPSYKLDDLKSGTVKVFRPAESSR